MSLGEISVKSIISVVAYGVGYWLFALEAIGLLNPLSAGDRDHFVNVCPTGRKIASEWIGAGGEEEFDDCEMVGFGLVDGGPDGAAEDGAAVVILCFEGSAGADEEFDDAFLTTIRCPMEGVESGVAASAGIEVVG